MDTEPSWIDRRKRGSVFGRTIPFVERYKMLFAIGESESNALLILQEEFRNFEVKEITRKTLEVIYHKNKDEFDKARREFMEQCQIISKEQLRHCFEIVRKTETELIESLNTKLKLLITQIDYVDVGTDEGRRDYAHLINLINITHDKLAAIAGTNAVRSVEEFTAKILAKKEVEEEGKNPMRDVTNKGTTFLR